MAAVTKPTLLEELQLSFPSLDSSLIAAFLSERDSGSLTKRQLRKLRRTLAVLATGADHDEQVISEALSCTHIDSSSISSSAIDRSHESSSAFSTITDAASPLTSPRLASACTASFSSLLGFLQAAFPEIPPARLERVIADASYDGGSADGVDAERTIELLLTQEYLGDLGEHGGTFGVFEENDPPPVSKGGQAVNANGKKRRKRAKTIALYDIRQQRHGDEGAFESRHGSFFIPPSKSSDVDIWTSVSSISAQLATLLHPHSESFFKSFFHSPESKTPATAVRRALTAITSYRDDDVPPHDMTILLNLQDILRSSPNYNELSEEERKCLFLDAHLCLQAVGPRTDNALDLVWLLRSLDADDLAGWKIAPYHQEPLPYEDNCILERSENKPFPTSASHVWPRLPSQPQDGWNLVSSRKRVTTAKCHSVSILASSDSHGTSKHEYGFVRDMDPARLKERRDDLQTRLREASMSAARAWKRGNSKNMGKQVALHHVEEVRRLQEELKDVALDAARARVNATKLVRQSHRDSSSCLIDNYCPPGKPPRPVRSSICTIPPLLRQSHSLKSVSETTVLLTVSAILYRLWTSVLTCRPTAACPMEFITGRGIHSAGGKAVLGPAVYGALIKDGWNASTLPAGIIVHGRLHD
ncbi:hypothetical protein F5888DRAFT_1743972 [Russula emetica]|nr:hypothetical protein F5888DRAFT_1743972 [Russula emetica]